MTVSTVDPNLIRAGASSGSAKTEPNAIDTIIAKLNEVVAMVNNASGAGTPGAGTFTSLSATGNTTIGDANTDVMTVNGYAGVGGTPNVNIQFLVDGTGRTYALYVIGLSQLAAVTASGTVVTQGDTVLAGAANTLGFYGSAGSAKQTGVAVTAAAIHAALVALGLISA